jgi:hypothetical protein
MNETAVLSLPEIEQYEGGSSVKGDTKHIGSFGRNEGRHVRYQIFCNVIVQNGGGESTPRQHAVALHEIPLLRKRYGMSGTVDLLPTWVTGTARVQGLSEAACRDEEKRLLTAYGADFTHVYGGQNGVPQTLWTKANDLVKAWNAMQAKCRDADRRMTREDIERVVEVISPREELLETLEPLESLNAPAAPATPSTIDGNLLQHLINAEVPDEKAQAFAAEVALAGGPVLSEEAWNRIPGVGTHSQRRNKLLRAYESYVGGGG